MCMKLVVIFCLVGWSVSQEGSKDWDLAVVISDGIELLQSNGSLVGSTMKQFNTLKALTFDNIRHQFIVSDTDELNDTIFSVELTKEGVESPIVQNLPDDVQGLAVDPISDTLFWTDSLNHTINVLPLNDSYRQSRILFTFPDQNPHGIVVDVCKRYLYWTNSNFNKPTIERSRLDGTEHEVLIDTDLRLPVGIAIDYNSQRLYWADMREGIYYRIESSNLDGKERELIYEGTHTKPFGLAVDQNAVYWTDVNNNALWKIIKYQHAVPERIRDFNEKPMGLIAKNLQITTLPDCKLIAHAVEVYNGSIVEVFEEESDESNTILECLNHGDLVNNSCVCRRGFSGRFCEISVCHNYCFHGNCRLSSTGYPTCHCPRGFGGNRCERNMCDGFCLNGGECSHHTSSRGSTGMPKCVCSEMFVGSRCEISADFENLCRLYCRNKDGDFLASRSDELICKCIEGSYKISKTNATTAQLLLAPQQQQQKSNDDTFKFTLDKLSDPVFLLQSILLLISILAIIFLSSYICTIRKRRPRIKKRIIVNKNITPLTYRPQPNTEQCEITIENCCNMNVCETPCFEPPKLRSFQRNDDKKKLLSNMENGEDLY